MPEPPQPPKPEPKRSIFSSKEETSPNVISDLSGQVNNISRALKQVEGKYDVLRKKAQLTEQNMLSTDKKIISDVKVINSELLDLKTDLNDLKEKLTLLVRELKLSATKDEVRVLQKYLSYWEPLNFVTRQELDKILAERRKL